MTAPPRVVLDTSVVLSALVFGGSLAGRVRAGWQAGRFVPLGSGATVQELVRALGYPKFGLAPSQQEELLADYLPWVEVVAIPEPTPTVPRCRDPFDLPFLQLAVAGRAKLLVSGDLDLLARDGARGLCRVVSVDAFCERWMVG